MEKKKKEIPKTGWVGFQKNWKQDAVAAISVSLVALPLSLAIAIAAGVPPISGLITAVIGGIITTFFKNSQLTINGPAAGLIGVILSAIIAFDNGCGSLQAFKYACAAFIFSGILQVIIGLLKYGRIADLFPTTVIHGILASIGIIIFANQTHVAMGTKSNADNTMGVLFDIFNQIPNINPYIAVISIIGLMLLMFHSKISYKVFHFIPAPVWVLAIAVPIVLTYQYLDANQISVFGTEFIMPKDFLIVIPDNWTDAIITPDFSICHTPKFWLVVISITLLSSVITLAGTKAVDKLDPYKRKTNLNRDLVAVGLSTIASGAVGGLPIITVIVRSTVNVHNNAKTKYSNLFHGLYIMLFVVLLTPVIQLFPKAALAAVLIVTGTKLASPKLFKEIYTQGLEQTVFLLSTIFITLYQDPLTGIIGGMGMTLLAHFFISRVSITEFIRLIFKSGTQLTIIDDDNYILRVKGIANFVSILKLSEHLEKIPEGILLRVDLSKTRLVDLTFQEKLVEFKKKHRRTGGRVQIIGLDQHISISNHRLSLKSYIIPANQKITPREQKIKSLAAQMHWAYSREEQIETTELSDFNFFKSRPIDLKSNIIGEKYENQNVDWEISDVTFEEGAMLSKEIYTSTMQHIHLPFEIPSFVLEGEFFWDKLFVKVLPVAGSDINFIDHPTFNKKYKLTGENIPAIKLFFNSKLIKFLESKDAYHIESNGNSLIIFKALKPANINEINKLVSFGQEIIELSTAKS